MTPSPNDDAAQRAGLPLERLSIAALLLAFGVAASRVAVSDFTDDSWVGLACARHLFAGEGFAFGARAAWGLVSPIFAVGVGFLDRLGLGLEIAARAIDLLALLVQGWAALGILATLGVGRGAARWTLLYAALVIWLPTSLPGNEVGLAVAAQLVAMRSALRGSWRAAGAAAALALALRPDGIAVVVAVAAAMLLAERSSSPSRREWLWLLVPAVAVAALTAVVASRGFWAQLERRQGDTEAYGGFAGLLVRQYFDLSTLNFMGVPVVAGFLAASVAHPRRLVIATFGASFALIHLAARLPGLPWYLCSANAWVLLLSAVAVVRVASSSSLRDRGAKLLLVLLLAAAGSTIYYYSFYNWLNELRPHAAAPKEQVYRAIATWMDSRLPPEGAFAAREVGYLSLASDLPAIDLGGYTTPEPHPSIPALLDAPDLVAVVLPSAEADALEVTPGGALPRRFERICDLPSWDYGAIAVYARVDLFDETQREDEAQRLAAMLRNIRHRFEISVENGGTK